MLRVFLFCIFIICFKDAAAKSDTTFNHSINLSFGITGKSHAIAFMPSFDISQKTFTLGVGPVINFLPSIYSRSFEDPRLTGIQIFARKYTSTEDKLKLFFEGNFIYQRFQDKYLGYTNIQNLYEAYAGYGFMFRYGNWNFFQNAGAGINRSGRLYDNSFGLQTRQFFYNFGLLGKLGASYLF